VDKNETCSILEEVNTWLKSEKSGMYFFTLAICFWEKSLVRESNGALRRRGSRA
jgi:hypothetical protein